MIRLSVDTSFEHLSICLTRNGKPLGNYYSLCNRSNVTTIFQVIDDLLKKAELSLAEVDAYIVNCGPGSYTGVRIGMSVVKTFAQVHNKPTVAVNSLELLAGQIRYLQSDFPVILNCTRREIFQSVFRIADKHPVAQTPIELTSLEKFIERSGDIPVVIYRVSPDRRKPEPLFEQLVSLPLDYPVPDALLLDRLGAYKLASSAFQSDIQLRPLYIKRDVEKIRKKNLI